MDEHDDSRSVMVYYLNKKLAAEVITATTIVEAHTLIRSQRFDLYLFENWVADGTGIDLCRQRRGVGDETPVIFYTGVATEAERRKALLAGGQAYILKPNLIELLQTVAAVLESVTAKGACPIS